MEKEKIELELRQKKDDPKKIAMKEREEEFRTGHIIRIFEKLIAPDELVIASQKMLNEKDDKAYRYKKELKHFNDMLDQSVRWRKAKDLRAYIDEREKKCDRKKPNDRTLQTMVDLGAEKSRLVRPLR